MIAAQHESWALAEPFTISRGTKTNAEVVVVKIDDEDISGRGECVPYGRYNESIPSVLAQIETTAPMLLQDLNRTKLHKVLPAGAARNALDCALWDLEAKKAGMRVWDLIELKVPQHLTCAYTLSLSDPSSMRAAAVKKPQLPLLKMKVGPEGVMERIEAVREGAPNCTLIVDANESWTLDMTRALMPELAAAGVTLVEQPLPAGEDHGLAEFEHLVPLAADESCHTSNDVEGLQGLYDVVNIKLDKSGGLTEALNLMRRASDCGLTVMVGCMVGTSLAMAPATLLGAAAKFVDLDGPLLLAQDRSAGLTYSNGQVRLPEPELWG